jgi:hypothetical protein
LLPAPILVVVVAVGVMVVATTVVENFHPVRIWNT